MKVDCWPSRKSSMSSFSPSSSSSSRLYLHLILQLQLILSLLADGIFTPQVICQYQTALLTCDHVVASSSLIIHQPEDVCHFVDPDFQSWDFQQNIDNTMSALTLTKCLSDPLCVFECLSSCKCITLEGLPCGECYEPVSPASTTPPSPQLNKYTMAFSICDAADAVITCPINGTSEPSCDFPETQFSKNTTSDNGTFFSLSLQGCNQPRCSAACAVPSGCTCVEGNGSPCGSTCPFPPPPTPKDKVTLAPTTPESASSSLAVLLSVTAQPTTGDTTSPNNDPLATDLDTLSPTSRSTDPMQLVTKSIAVCQGETALVTCPTKYDPFNQGFCRFTESQFTDWSLVNNTFDEAAGEEPSATLTLSTCQGTLCSFAFQSQCDCITSNGYPCGMCKNDVTGAVSNFTSAFIFCGSESTDSSTPGQQSSTQTAREVSVTCLDAPLRDLDYCTLIGGQFNTSQQFAKLFKNDVYEIYVESCLEQETCTVACQSSSCTCMQLDNDTPCDPQPSCPGSVRVEFPQQPPPEAPTTTPSPTNTSAVTSTPSALLTTISPTNDASMTTVPPSISPTTIATSPPTSSSIGGVTYTVSTSEQHMAFTIHTGDSITLLCDSGNTNYDSNICNRSQYVAFTNWEIAYGIRPEQKPHNATLINCRNAPYCEIQCDRQCTCYVGQGVTADDVADAPLCNGGAIFSENGTANGYDPGTRMPTFTPTTETTATVTPSLSQTTTLPPTTAATTTATTVPPSFPPTTAATTTATTVPPSLPPTTAAPSSLPSPSPPPSSSSFQVCGLSSATIICRKSSLNACQYNTDDFDNWQMTMDSFNTTTLTLGECKSGGDGCNVTCAATAFAMNDDSPAVAQCTCVGPDGVTPCGECENSNAPSSSSFGLCTSTSALITCNSSSLSACTYKGGDFVKWNVTLSYENEATFLLEKCLDGTRCEVDCEVDQCTCVDSLDGSGCVLCDENGNVIEGTQQTDDDDVVGNINDYQQLFEVCGSTSATIVCQNTSLDICTYNKDNFEDWNVTVSSDGMASFTLNGCLDSSCLVGCLVEQCICIDQDSGLPCGGCAGTFVPQSDSFLDGTIVPQSNNLPNTGGGVAGIQETSNVASTNEFELIPGENVTYYTAKDAIISCPSDSFCEYTATEFVNITMMGSEWSSTFSADNGNGKVVFHERDVLKARGCNKGPASLVYSIDRATNRDRNLDLQDTESMCEVTCSNTCVCMTDRGEVCSLQEALVAGFADYTTSGLTDARGQILLYLTTALGMMIAVLGSAV